MPWWFLALLAATAAAVSIGVNGWTVRLVLVTFAVNRVLSIPYVAQSLSIGPITFTVLNVLFACTLIIAAWPKAGRNARIGAVVLFVAGMAVGFWVDAARSSVVA